MHDNYFQIQGLQTLIVIILESLSIRIQACLSCASLSETSFDKNPTWQGRGTEMRKNGDEDEEARKITRDRRIVSEGRSSEC